MGMWCPSEDTSGKSKTTTIHQIEGIAGMLCWFKAMIMFPTLSQTRKFDTMDGLGPKPQVNAWKLDELLEKAGTSFEDIKTDGAVISLRFMWKCNVQYMKCKDTELLAKRLDPEKDPVAKGFSFRQAFYYYKGEELVRDEYTRYGVRFFVVIRRGRQETGLGSHDAFGVICNCAAEDCRRCSRLPHHQSSQGQGSIRT